MEINEQQIGLFREVLADYYARNARDTLPWRRPEPDGQFSPYKILVSELMLQQTQVQRVIPKYEAFLAQFPGVDDLARAELGEVLRAWQGLGYNRRAKYLWLAARAVHAETRFPRELAQLVALPGVGVNTAGAVLAYAFNQPAVFVETNIRTVYIHHFFEDQAVVHDMDIIRLVEQTIDREDPRTFYWSLMDYGSYLKATVGNLNTASKQYVKQSAFHGSRRQLRGQVLRVLGQRATPVKDLQRAIVDERLPGVLEDLEKEGMVQRKGSTYSL